MIRSLAVCATLGWCLTAFGHTEGATQQGHLDTQRKSQEPPGKAIFLSFCAQCHGNSTSNAPATTALKYMTASAIYTALTDGRMRGLAAPLSDQQRREVAEYLSQTKLSDSPPRSSVACRPNAKWFDTRERAVGNGWGIDAENTRLIPAEQAGISVSQLNHLTLQWTFAFPCVSAATAQPLIAGSGLFVGSQDGTVYALDAQSGCVRWTFKARGEIPGSLVLKQGPVGTAILFVADRRTYVYALDAVTGQVVWEAKVDDHPMASIMGTPTAFEDRLYVPVASLEEDAASVEGYSCCTFRGSVVALEASTGKVIWKRYAIPAPSVEHKNALGVTQYGPSGAGVWGSPAVDRKRGLLYFLTGNSYSEPNDENSNAIFAIDLASGEVKWRMQTARDDNWNMWDYRCRYDPQWKSRPNCPSLAKPGADIDFSTAPVLVHGPEGRDVLVAGRKDGITFGVDPDTGTILWATRTSPDPEVNTLLFFGIMADGSAVYVPSATVKSPTSGFGSMSSPLDGLHALDAFTGARRWSAPVAADCDHKQPCLGVGFAPIGIPGAVFAGAMDGMVRAYDSASGKVLWRFDTAQEFTTINGEVGKGGAVGRNGIMIGNGMVYVSSGWRQKPGNVLLAFSAMDRAQSKKTGID